MPEESQTSPIGGPSVPLGRGGPRVPLGMVICFVIVVAVTDAVREGVRNSLDFWPAYAVEVVAGGAAALASFAVWQWYFNRRS